MDLEKAYNRICWSFINDMLKKAGLSESWIRNIMVCVETTSMSISWNGKNSKCFRPSRGIRQGDPISPYLFVLCMERLGHLINQEVDEERWKPLQMSQNSPPVSHMFFVDDLLLFAKALRNILKLSWTA